MTICNEWLSQQKAANDIQNLSWSVNSLLKYASEFECGTVIKHDSSMHTTPLLLSCSISFIFNKHARSQISWISSKYCLANKFMSRNLKIDEICVLLCNEACWTQQSLPHSWHPWALFLRVVWLRKQLSTGFVRTVSRNTLDVLEFNIQIVSMKKNFSNSFVWVHKSCVV